jgi:hypothetical protein
MIPSMVSAARILCRWTARRAIRKLALRLISAHS